MTINTKFEYGQEVYYMRNNKINKGVVAELRIVFTYCGYSGAWNSQAFPMREEYAFYQENNKWVYLRASSIFPTKEQLINTLQKDSV